MRQIAGPTFARLDNTHALPPIVSLHPSGFTGIAKYDRFELGFMVPRPLQPHIDGFLARAYPGHVHLPTDLNPYDPDQVRVEVDYTLGAAIYTRYGFYYKDFSHATGAVSAPSTFNGPNPWHQVPTPYTFRVRFAPPAIGNWAYELRLFTHDTLMDTYTGTFSVVDSPNPGFLIVDDYLQKMTFADSGRAFFGIGQNVAFAAESLYNAVPADPYTYSAQRSYIADLAAHQGNFVRIRLDPWSNPVESRETTVYYGDPAPAKTLARCLNNYDHNQRHMWEFDATLALCEQKSVYIVLNLLEDQYFSPDSPYGPSVYVWGNNPYASLQGAANWYVLCGAYPGAGDNLYDFFSLATTKQIYQKQLFYINARWGYSPSIAMWEHINETDNLYRYYDPQGTLQSGFDACPPDQASFRAKVLEWTCEMKGYLDQFYPPHIQTSGFGGYPWCDGRTLDRDTWDCTPGQPNVPAGCCRYEVFSVNHYSLNAFPNLGRANGARIIFWDQGQSFFLGEIGGTPTSDLYSDREFHNSLWAGAFSGSVSTPLYWWHWEEPWGKVHHRANFDGLSTFLRNHVDFSRKLHPRQITSQSGSHATTPPVKYLHNHYLATSSANATEAYGWCQNRSYWSGNDPAQQSQNPLYGLDMNQSPYDGYASFFDTDQMDAYDIDPGQSPGDPLVTFTGLMPNAAFDFDYYKTVNGTHVGTISASSDASGVLAVPLALARDDSTPNRHPDYAYTLRALR